MMTRNLQEIKRGSEWACITFNYKQKTWENFSAHFPRENVLSWVVLLARAATLMLMTHHSVSSLRINDFVLNVATSITMMKTLKKRDDTQKLCNFILYFSSHLDNYNLLMSICCC